MLILQLKNNLTNTEIPNPLKKNHGLHIKVSLIFWFFIMTAYVFMTNCGLNGYVHILEIDLDILDKLFHVSRNGCGCLTMNEINIKLVSLVICSIDDNLTNTSSTRLPEVKKTVLYRVHLVIFCTSTETSIYWKFKHKIFNLFQALNQHNFRVSVLWKFLQVLIMSVLMNWVFKYNNLAVHFKSTLDIKVTVLVLTVFINYRIKILVMLFITSWCRPLKTDPFREIFTYAIWLHSLFAK